MHNLWRYYFMKNNMMKNLVKSMAEYGELLNRIGG